VRNKAQITHLIKKIAEGFGRLDFVVPDSGVAIYGAGEEFSEASYRDTLGVNLDSAFSTAQAAANVFKRLVAAKTIRQGASSSQPRSLQASPTSSMLIDRSDRAQ
jgi:sorbose reductase